MDEGTRRFMRLRWGKDERNMAAAHAIKLVYAIKNPGLEFCAIKAGIQQLSSRGRGLSSFLETFDVECFLVTNLFMSTLLMQTLLCSAP